MPTAAQIREFAPRVLGRVAKSIQFPSLSESVNYPPGITLLDHYLKSRLAEGKLALPDYGAPNETLAVFSDYAGDERGSLYHSYSYLLVAYNYTDLIRDVLLEIRAEHGMLDPPREIALKELRYGPMGRMLPGYLDALDRFIAGWLVTILVDKEVPSLLGIGGDGASAYISRVLDDAGVGGWKPAVAERMLRVTHFAAYLSALAAPRGTKVFWMTDNDAIVPNDVQAERAMKIFISLLREYAGTVAPMVGYATPFQEDPSTLHRDLLSATDLAAGAFARYCTSRVRTGSHVSRQRNRPIFDWLGRPDRCLRKTTMVIEPADDNHLKVTGLQGQAG